MSQEADEAGDGRDVPSITPDALQARVDDGDPVRLLDLRNRDEVEQWRLSGPGVALTQLPYNRFVQARVTGEIDALASDVDGDGPITVVCARGEASADVAADLQAAGYDARNLAGGMEGWARVVQSFELDSPGLIDRSDDGDAAVVQYRRPASGCMSYMVISDGEAAVVDPLRAFVDRYVADADERGAEIRYAIDTHVHADHVSGLRGLAEAADATPVLPGAAAERGVAFDVETVADGDELRVGDAALTAVRAPGHTSGMTAFSVDDVLLTGDSLFVEGVARPDLERGDEGARDLARELYRTLTERFGEFPDDALVAPGHHGADAVPDDNGITTTLGSCRGLASFKLSESEFVDFVTGDVPPRPANYERVIAINLGRAAADEEEAFELELGPNNCAATPTEAG